MTKRRIVIGGFGVALLGMMVCCSDKPENTVSGSTKTGGSPPGIIGNGGTTPAPGTGGTAAVGNNTSAAAGECNLENITFSNGKCAQGQTSAQLRTANVLLVIDKSGSMTQSFGTSSTSKWDGMKNALNTALDSKRSINFGLDLFPASDVTSTCQAISPTNNQCCVTKSPTETLDVPVGPGVTTVDAIIAKLNETSPGGGTPTAAALARAYAYFTVGAGAALQGDKYVLLATDGGPNCNLGITTECSADRCTRNLDNVSSSCTETGLTCCNSPTLYSSCLDDGAVLAQLQDLNKAGITTFVVGIPGSKPYMQYLNAFAEAGGHPQPAGPSGATYYEVNDAQQLVDTFEQITIDLVTSCDLQTNQEIAEPGNITVLKDCVPVPNTDWTAVGGTKLITITGNTCEQIKSTGARRVDYIFGCTVVM
jgi:hypothetical protein